MAESTRVIESGDATNRRPANRRELILRAAIELFHERGYPATSVDDIGKAVDVSGPAIYRHFSSKEAILLEAMQRAADEVHAANRAARASNDDPRLLLEGYIRAYATVAVEQSALIAVWTSEARHVAGDGASSMVRRLRSWVAEWREALLEARPELNEQQARVLVAGAVGQITSVATTVDHTVRRECPTDWIVAMALATLDTALDQPSSIEQE